MQHIHGSGDEGLVSSVAVPLLTTQVKMLEFGSKLMSSHTASLALHCCQFTPLDGSTSFVPAFHAVYKVLNALLVHNTNTVYGVIPSFLSCTKHILLHCCGIQIKDLVTGVVEPYSVFHGRCSGCEWILIPEC
ncbi:uncharacterized protein LOC110444187 [Mizuhopecten yessoensis]|uniref:uncharacterized protein LOC110444187 n=1 Tax=Mizuhopecten yessoensis TaxID=6573 RepID=UPI000B45871C|nr:uncharacterized protein LOC110444187 [Mizuhopecten yessoensis]